MSVFKDGSLVIDECVNIYIYKYKHIVQREREREREMGGCQLAVYGLVVGREFFQLLSCDQ